MTRIHIRIKIDADPKHRYLLRPQLQSVFVCVKVYALQWSPLGRVVATWEQYATTAGQEAKPNLHLWDAKENT